MILTSILLLLLMSFLRVKFSICFFLRCGENERPLNEFLILQLGAEHPNGRQNISICKFLGRQRNQENKMLMEDTQHKQVYVQRYYVDSATYDILV